MRAALLTHVAACRKCNLPGRRWDFFRFHFYRAPVRLTNFAPSRRIIERIKKKGPVLNRRRQRKQRIGVKTRPPAWGERKNYEIDAETDLTASAGLFFSPLFLGCLCLRIEKEPTKTTEGETDKGYILKNIGKKRKEKERTNNGARMDDKDFAKAFLEALVHRAMSRRGADRSAGSTLASRYPTPLLRTLKTKLGNPNEQAALVERLRADLDAGSPVDAKDYKGRTALHHAVKKLRALAARFLIERGADPLAENNIGCSPLALAATNMIGSKSVINVALVDAMLKHMRAAGRDADIRRVLDERMTSDPNGNSLTRTAIASCAPGDGSALLLDVCLAHGADPDKAVSDGRLPCLHAAVGSGSTEKVLALLAHGADVNAPKGDGATPLHFAVFREKHALCAILLRRGANPNLRFGEPGKNDHPLWRGADAALVAAIDGHRLLSEAIREYPLIWDPHLDDAAVAMVEEASD
jgi:ankyrin repeat protein